MQDLFEQAAKVSSYHTIPLLESTSGTLDLSVLKKLSDVEY